MTTRTQRICDRCETSTADNNDPKWAVLLTHHGGSALALFPAEGVDLCPLCAEAFAKWFSGSVKVPGRASGGHSRAAKLTPERRQEIGRQGAAARWNGKT